MRGKGQAKVSKLGLGDGVGAGVGNPWGQDSIGQSVYGLRYSGSKIGIVNDPHFHPSLTFQGTQWQPNGLPALQKFSRPQKVYITEPSVFVVTIVIMRMFHRVMMKGQSLVA